MIDRGAQIMIVLLLVTIFGLGIYAIHLKHRAEVVPQQKIESRAIAPPAAGPPQTVTFWVASDQDGLLHKRTASLVLPRDPDLRAREILETLVSVYTDKGSPHPLGAGAEITDVFLLKNSDVIVNANQAFADGHRSGVMVEEMTVASLAQTLAANTPGLARMKILIQGKERETLAGHVDLTTFYNLNQEPWPTAER
jgi:hypothetical protein